MEACLELMKFDAIIGLQDMGAAGLTSSSVEIAASSKLGIKINLDKVPLRDGNMTLMKIMLSESQENAYDYKTNKLNIAKKIFEKWELIFLYRRVLNPHIRILSKKVVADIPLDYCNAKVFRRPFIIKKNYYQQKIV